eukprot:TRINITY_DN16290_c0_g1_i1.p2 TRINITY_DN16290_c0_g1~~TRINITY_DN16290_c0_g1_i1.p2  ORF type:complete len:446 (+),score=146.51 TRINITY_DN16290_c0_g1_i1:64-1401(+)
MRTVLLAAAAAGAAAAPSASQCDSWLASGHPPVYFAHKVNDADITIDGKLDEEVWRDAPAVTDFKSIYGDLFQQQHPEQVPWHKTKGQILWSDSFVYVAGHLDEPNLWAIDQGWVLPTQEVSPEHPRFECNEDWIPSCPYRSADFEFFISPGPHGNTEWYKEFEFNTNAYAPKGPSVMTLALPRPYHDLHGKIPLWLNPDICPELKDCQYKVATDGKVNDPAWAAKHPNSSWTVEVKIPIEYLIKNVTGAARPADGVQWRHGFSRVEYHLKPNASAPGGYSKVFTSDLEREQGHLDRNWVWPPTYMYDVHMPDLWSVVQFSSARPGAGPAPTFNEAAFNWPAYGTLSRLYYAQWDAMFTTGNYSSSLDALQNIFATIQDPAKQDAWKKERQIIAFPTFPTEAWACVEATVRADAETGWMASVRLPGLPSEVWTIDGWRRITHSRS